MGEKPNITIIGLQVNCRKSNHGSESQFVRGQHPNDPAVKEAKALLEQIKNEN
jgi:hypothetical protein